MSPRALAWRGAAVVLAVLVVLLMPHLLGSYYLTLLTESLIYGVTSAPGDAASAALDEQGRGERPTRLWTAMSFGEALPERVVRAIVLARLANFLEGHAAVRGPLPDKLAVAAGGRGTPPVWNSIPHGRRVLVL